MKKWSRYAVALAAAVLSAAGVSATQAAWEPTRPAEIIVPAGTGGGADQMARVIQGIVTKHNLMKQSLAVINKPGGAGGEGFLDVKGSRGNPHKLVITLSNLFTTPLATGIPFNWRDGPDPGRHDGARRVHSVSTCRHTLQERAGIHQRRESGPAWPVQDGRHGLQAGGSDHHRGDREGNGH
jgi:hypothetical protein